MYKLIPLHDFREVAETVDCCLTWIGRAGDIAAVLDVNTKLRDRLDEASDAQGFRTHTGTQRARSDVSGCANQADAMRFHRADVACGRKWRETARRGMPLAADEQSANNMAYD